MTVNADCWHSKYIKYTYWTDSSWKLCGKLKQFELTSGQKQKWIVSSTQRLELSNLNKFRFLRRYVAVGEEWLRHFTPESKRQSSKCTACFELNLKPGARK